MPPIVIEEVLMKLESLVHCEMEFVARSKVPVVDKESLLPAVKPMFVLAVKVASNHSSCSPP